MPYDGADREDMALDEDTLGYMEVAAAEGPEDAAEKRLDDMGSMLLEPGDVSGTDA